MAEPHVPPPPSGPELPPATLAEVIEHPTQVHRQIRLFGSPSFLRLWLAQVVSSLGDWIGLIAILALAQRIGGGSSEASIAFVMSARMIPGFFLASVGGVLVDRWDRKRVMVTCDIGRGLVLASLPFIDHVWELFLASLVIEVFTLFWSPAKEASVPNLVRADQLTTANSLSLAAAYGTFPLAGVISAVLFKVAETLGRHYHGLHFLRIGQESIAIYFDVATFLVSAALISTLVLARRPRRTDEERVELAGAFTEVKEGWRFIGTTPVVRAVLLGLATGLIGGAMVVPLGPVFAKKVLRAGDAGFGLLLTGLGTGVAAGVLGVSSVQKRLPRERIFPLALGGAGVSMLFAASMATLAPAMALVACMGVCAGAVYVVGFTLIQENVDDDLRGRVFATLYTLVRFSVLLALTLGPLFAGLLDTASRHLVGGSVHLGSVGIALTGVRLTLWLGACIILAAGASAFRTLRHAAVVRTDGVDG